MLRIFLKNKILHCKVQNVLNIAFRQLNLMEFQNKILLKKNGLTTENFCIVNTKIGFKDFEQFDAEKYAVKAQILAGGRGKGYFDNGFHGGVRIAKDKKTAKKYVNNMLGYNLITKQTPKTGLLVNNVMVTENVNIEKETYVCLALDRQCNGPVVMASPKGGVDIEDVARNTPHLIRKIPIDIYEGLTSQIGADVSDFIQFKRELKPKLIEQLKRLWKMFLKFDALQIEINPLVSTREGTVSCIDAKLNFDDNAKFRQNDIFSIKIDGLDPKEVEASKYNLNYVKMDGNIGCLVNGAGLAMATMDIIKLYGQEPANFLDIGGSVSQNEIKKAFEILTSDKNVKVILVNVFGGIVNCEMVAKTICEIENDLKVPTVVRLEGTNAEKGRHLIRKARHIQTADDFAEAAQKAVDLAK